MKNKNILITINNINDLNKLQELGITNFVFPLKGFCVGMPNTFLISEIPKDGYIMINRILDNKGIDELKIIFSNLPKNIKGIIFDDLGVLEIIKNLDIEKILFLNHFNTNSKSIKIFLEFVDSVVVSTDITKKEIEEIVKKIPNKFTAFVLGYVNSMYSRRLLLDNYSKFHKIEKKNPLHIDNTGHKFMVYENSYGTVFYHEPLFNGLKLLELPFRYYFINSAFLTIKDIEELLNGTSKIETSDDFLQKNTIYKLKGDE